MRAISVELDELISTSKELCAQGVFLPYVEYYLRYHINLIRRTAECEHVDENSNIFSESESFLKNLQAIILRLHQILQAVCGIAKPGVVVEDFVSVEINRLVREPLFAEMVNLGAEAIAYFINSDENIRNVHEMVMCTRFEACKPYLFDESEDFAQIKAELKKITNYRVRRNVIERLYHFVLHDASFRANELTWMGDIITAKQETCLLMLQQAFLHALYRQVERMTLDDAWIFLEGFRNHLLIKPLPKTNIFGKKNAVAYEEYALFLKTCQSNVVMQSKPVESPSLHDIDCPIEQDIIGEITKRLVDAIHHRSSNMHSFNTILEITERAYRKLLAPDFKCEPRLEELALDCKKHDLLTKALLQIQNKRLRLVRILMIYDDVKDLSNVKKQCSPYDKAHPRRKAQAKAIQKLQGIYLQTVEEIVHDTDQGRDSDKYKVFKHLLISIVESALFKDHVCTRPMEMTKQRLVKMLSE